MHLGIWRAGDGEVGAEGQGPGALHGGRMMLQKTGTGRFGSLLQLNFSVTGGVDAQTSALGYFITPCVGILLSIICYLSLPHLVSLPLG